jgi:hypothetical protein
VKRPTTQRFTYPNEALPQNSSSAIFFQILGAHLFEKRLPLPFKIRSDKIFANTSVGVNKCE